MAKFGVEFKHGHFSKRIEILDDGLVIVSDNQGREIVFNPHEFADFVSRLASAGYISPQFNPFAGRPEISREDQDSIDMKLYGGKMYRRHDR